VVWHGSHVGHAKGLNPLSVPAGIMATLSTRPYGGFDGWYLPLCGWYQLVPWIRWLSMAMAMVVLPLRVVVGLTPTDQTSSAPEKDGMQAQVRPLPSRSYYQACPTYPHVS